MLYVWRAQVDFGSIYVSTLFVVTGFRFAFIYMKKKKKKLVVILHLTIVELTV